MEIYLKTEPAGEVSAGKLNDEEVAKLRSLFRSGEMLESDLVQFASEIDNLGHAYGLFCADESQDPQAKRTEIISIPKKDDGACEDGFYITYTALSKCSLHLDFDPNDDDEEESKLTYEYTEFDFDELEHFSYGDLKFNVITRYLYNGEEIPEAEDAELIDRGIDREIVIIQIKDDELREIYRATNYSDEYWDDFID